MKGVKRSFWGCKTGDIVADRYLIEDMLGKGAMGTVFLAQHLLLKTPVAIKMIDPVMSRDEHYRQTFAREARVSSMLRHPNAVEIHDFGEHEGMLYLAMEFLSGQTLHSTLASVRQLLSWERIYPIVLQISEVLCAAHKISLVHRDLKPDNIMIEKSVHGGDHVKVVDFGLAFVEESSDEALGRLTEYGVTAGTPAYMPPEQARGLVIGPEADTYAFGAILYELATGKPPFLGKSVIAVLNAHLYQPVVPPRHKAPGRKISAGFESLVLHMLTKDPNGRPSAIEVQRRLQHLSTAHSTPGFVAQRGARTELSREDRAVAPARSTMLAHPDSLSSLTTKPVRKRALGTIALVGVTQEDPLLVGLGANQLRCVCLSPDDKPDEEVDIVVFPGASLEAIEAWNQYDMPVVTTVQAGDLDRIAALLRLGVKEVVTEPMRVEELTRKLTRLLRKLKRTLGKP